MADYKLKLDIDEKELAKKIEKALKGAKIDTAMFGEGSGPGSSSKQYQGVLKTVKDINKNITILHKTDTRGKTRLINLEREHTREKIKGRLDVEREARARQKMNRQMAGYNTLLRQATGSRGGNVGKNIGALFGGRAGGAVGAGIDAIGPMMKLMKAKRNLAHLGDGTPEDPEFIGPKMPGRLGKLQQTKAGKALSGAGKTAAMPVKVAGFLAGMAGAAGFGKMIIDSSPVLKAMLKILNIGIMLILRPIGDFIGFMLRPLLIEFVKKVAIPAYKQGAKFAKEWGTKLGKALLLFFTNPEEFLIKAIVNPLRGSFEKGLAGINRWLRIVAVMLNPFNPNRDADIQKIKDEEQSTNAAIDAKYPGLFPGIGDTELGQKLQEFQDASTEELYTVQEKLDNVKNAYNEKIDGAVVPVINEGNILLTSIDEQIKKLVEIGMTQAQAMAAITPGTPEYNKAHFGYEDTSSKEEAIRKGQKIFADMNKKKQEKWMDDQRKAQEEIIKNTKPKTVPNYANPYHEKGGMGDPSQNNQVAFLSDSALRILAKFNNYKQNIGEYQGNGQQSSCGGSYDLGEGAVESRKEMEILTQALQESGVTGEEVSSIYNRLKSSATEQELNANSSSVHSKNVLMIHKDICGNYKIIEDKTSGIADGMSLMYDKVISALGKMKVYRSDSGKKIYKNEATQTLNELQKNVFTKTKQETGWQVTLSNGKVLRIPNPPGLSKESIDYYKKIGASVKGYASGGIINEPIFGIGQNSGKSYSFGEAGPERVTPGVGNTSSSGNNTFHITVNGVKNTDEFEKLMRPIMLRLLKESTSRAGIV